MDNNQSISCVILAGGLARRMDGQDKGLIPFLGKPLISHIIEVITPQVDEVLINANRNHEVYQQYNLPVLSDSLDGFQGPLAGMKTALDRIQNALLLTAPCDGPYISENYAKRMYTELTKENAEIAVAFDGKRIQPVYALISSHLTSSLDQFLKEGGRKIDAWYAQHKMVNVDFSDNPMLFTNINTPEQLAEIESQY